MPKLSTAPSLNNLKPAPGAKTAKFRVGRGIGSGMGKTCGKGHKGQKARAGGYHKVGFEGGQMPMQRRLPKVGFRSRSSLSRAEIRLSDLAKVDAPLITIATLRAAGLITANIKTVKLILSGKLNKAVACLDIPMTKGANDMIVALGGTVNYSPKG
jgi:large subunit ribosomal protein L15